MISRLYSSKHIGTTSLIILGGSFLGQLIGYVYAVSAARHAGALEYGYFSLALGLISICTALTVLGLNRTIVRFISVSIAENNPAQLKGVVWGIGVFLFVVSLTIAIIVAWFAPSIASSYLHDSQLITLVRTCAWIIPLSVTVNFLFESLRGMGLSEYRTYVDSFLQKPLKNIAIFGFTQGITALSLVIIEIIAYAAGLLAASYLLARKMGPMVRRSATLVPYRSLLAFSLPLVPGGLLSAFGNQTELLVLGWTGLVKEAGVFNAAMRNASFGAIILLAFNANFASAISSLSDTGKLDELRQLFRTITRWQLMLMMGWCGLMILLADDILALFGDDFAGTRFVLIVLSVRQVADTILGPVGLMVTMGGRAFLTLVNNLAFLAISIVLDLLLIPSFGAVGAAWAVLLTVVLLNVFVSLQVWRIYQTHALSRHNVTLTILSLGTAFSLLFFRTLYLASWPYVAQILFVMLIFSSVYSVLVFVQSSERERQIMTQAISNILSHNRELNSVRHK